MHDLRRGERRGGQREARGSEVEQRQLAPLALALVALRRGVALLLAPQPIAQPTTATARAPLVGFVAALEGSAVEAAREAKPAVRRGLDGGRRGGHVAAERGQIVAEDERVPQQLLHDGQRHEHEHEGPPRGGRKHALRSA